MIDWRACSAQHAGGDDEDGGDGDEDGEDGDEDDEDGDEDGEDGSRAFHSDPKQTPWWKWMKISVVLHASLLYFIGEWLMRPQCTVLCVCVGVK